MLQSRVSKLEREEQKMISKIKKQRLYAEKLLETQRANDLRYKQKLQLKLENEIKLEEMRVSNRNKERRSKDRYR